MTQGEGNNRKRVLTVKVSENFIKAEITLSVTALVRFQQALAEDALTLTTGKLMEVGLLLIRFHVRHLGFGSGDPTGVMVSCSHGANHQEVTTIPPTSRDQV